ncbi:MULTISPECIES: hypothetical protein [unclassified Arthrobacter]|uniref:hypothetical protein n=1 Tax=unclassified Arthrobacter TaxID=235627 RepID=UPI001D1474DC|nr:MULTISPECIES: hypothetical protein [unclassified Arthrobacter]MCC3277353.1 hypothetical protein [Arthrobacter sp. zg-Y20]MCC3280046.1 hypothetical protein [Arthrobacter sp. zg-Y40]MCC9178207.1 hypothetical protein [Arthrobacter sp. zg-Y750]MDK1317513.1 hypothetical protein [Arthrobacter sp. zg.Y20]MDK1328397.1 hypothetical protein [Arthrobacter sp. zg-Y1143]
MNDDGAQYKTQTLAEQSRRPGATDEQKKNAVRYVRVFWLLVLVMLLSSGLVLPWKLVPLAIGLVAFVVGIIALVKLARRRMGALLPVLVSLGLVITFLTTLGLGFMVAIWDQTVTYETCMRSALTLDGAEACQAEYLPFQQMR